MDDCGGGYSESIAEICEELQNGLTPLLIVTPNGRDESGANRDCYLFSPAARAPVHTNMFRFLGGHSVGSPAVHPRSAVLPLPWGAREMLFRVRLPGWAKDPKVPLSPGGLSTCGAAGHS